MKDLAQLTIAIKGAGEMASAVAWRLYMANIRRVVLMDTAHPLAIRRQVSFCEAIYEGRQEVEGVCALAASRTEQIRQAWSLGLIGVAVDPEWRLIPALAPDVCVDAIMAKRNLGTKLTDAPLVIGLGPGFEAPRDVHMVIETLRGHHLGRIITSGGAAPDTGTPGDIGGHTYRRLLLAPADGLFDARVVIGDRVARHAIVAQVGSTPLRAPLDGWVRGLIRTGTQVRAGWKVGDIDPRDAREHCATISDKARAISGSVLEAILRVFLSSLEKR